MTCSRSRRIAVATAALALAVFVPAISAHAAALKMTNFTPKMGKVGTKVTITGTGFLATDTVQFNGTQAVISTLNKPGTKITTSVPAFATSGPITITDPAGLIVGLPGTTFVIKRGISASPNRVWPGGSFTLAGSALPPDRVLQIKIGTVVVGEMQTDASGDGQTGVGVPWSRPSGKTKVSLTAAGLKLSSVLYILGDWPSFRHDASNSGYDGYETAIKPSTVSKLKEKWADQLTGSVSSSPVVANGVVYVGDGSNTFYAFGASGCGSATCSPLWTAATGSGVFATPVVANGVVYVGSEDGKLYAFAAAGCGSPTCSPLWVGPTGGDEIQSSPTVSGGVVYVGADDHKLYAFDAAGCGSSTCSPLWTAAVGNGIISSPAVANGVVFVGGDDNTLYAFDAAGCGSSTCSPLWTASIGSVVESSPAVSGGVVYVTSDKLYAFDASGCGSSTCSPLWTAALPALSGSSPAVAGGVVYVGAWGQLFAFDAAGCGSATCSPLWATAVGGGSSLQSPSVAGGVVYTSGDQATSLDTLYAFNASGCGSPTCAPVWFGAPGGALSDSPAVADGVVYIGSYDRKLYALGL
jgi:outer membrane protein assembly factor BamB